MVTQEAPNTTPETQKSTLDIPKSREIYSGDINDAVIKVQQITGFEITPDWWMSQVGNEGSTESILQRFDEAFEEFIRTHMGINTEEDNTKSNEEVDEAEILAEADEELRQFTNEIPDTPENYLLKADFIEALDAHLNEKYFKEVDQAESNVPMVDFELTQPEQRKYKVGEEYRFLVHVPLGDAGRRIDEIGSDRDGVLMASLVSGHHQGTFSGEGGIILSNPETGAIKGMAKSDVGGEIQPGRYDELTDMTQPASTAEYNQIDLRFKGSEPIGVMIKLTPDGRELGDSWRNNELRRCASELGIPIVEIEVSPSELTQRFMSRTDVLPGEQGKIITVDSPLTNEYFARIQVLKVGPDSKIYYLEDGVDTVTRTMLINSYGVSSQIIPKEQLDTIIDLLQSNTETPLQSSDIDKIKTDWKTLNEKSAEKIA